MKQNVRRIVDALESQKRFIVHLSCGHILSIPDNSGNMLERVRQIQETKHADCPWCPPEPKVTDAQPAPRPNDGPCIQDLVIADIKARKTFGIQKYGTALQPFNGRDALVDAYQEALDLVQYLRQEIEERDARKSAAVPDPGRAS